MNEFENLHCVFYVAASVIREIESCFVEIRGFVIRKRLIEMGMQR